MLRYPIALVLVLAACFGAQSLALRKTGGKTLKSESNYFSSMARLQTEARGNPRVLLLGSSMIARLSGHADPALRVGNIGCDGGSAVVTLRAMDRGELPTAPLLVVEANSLAFELEGRGHEIGAAIGSAMFRFGSRVPNFSATARPAAFAYSILVASTSDYNLTMGNAKGLSLPSEPGVLSPAPMPQLDSKAAALVEEIAGILQHLEMRGSKILLVMLPPGAPEDSAQTRIPRAIAAKSGVGWWDLNQGLPKETVGYTDGLHLDPASAQKVMETLEDGWGR
jgi:hypothetical protein